MPLKKGKKNMSSNIRELMTEKPSARREKAIKTIAKKEGISKEKAKQKQAVAIAYNMASKKKK